MYEVAGKTVLITGSSAGLGKQLALTLLNEGAQLMINGRNHDKLTETRNLLRGSGNHVASFQGDVSKPEVCKNMILACIREYGRLDILINNAGTGANGLFRDTIPGAAKIVIENNLMGSIYPTSFALPYIQESRGSIIFISSLAGIHGIPFNSIYSASKMALTALAQTLRIELSGSGIHIGIMYVGSLKNEPDKKIIGGDGLPVLANSRPEKFSSMPLEEASSHIVRAIRKRKPVKVLSPMGTFLYYVNRISPFLVRKVLALSREKLKQIYIPESE